MTSKKMASLRASPTQGKSPSFTYGQAEDRVMLITAMRARSKKLIDSLNHKSGKMKMHFREASRWLSNSSMKIRLK